MKFLYVEDQPMNVRLMQGFLVDELGCEFIHAGSVPEAMRCLETEYDISVIITDLHLPGSSGLVLLQKLRSNPGWRKIPTIVCTGDTNKVTVMEVARLGVRHFMCKPVTLDKLSEKLKEALGQSGFETPRRMELLLDLGLTSTELDEIQVQARRDLEQIVAKRFSDRSWEERNAIVAKLWPWIDEDETVEMTNDIESRSA